MSVGNRNNQAHPSAALLQRVFHDAACVKDADAASNASTERSGGGVEQLLVLHTSRAGQGGCTGRLHGDVIRPCVCCRGGSLGFMEGRLHHRAWPDAVQGRAAAEQGLCAVVLHGWLLSGVL